MPIDITCPGCHTRFKVSDEFAGKKGPCPKCKTVISIPGKGEEVVVHAPAEYGPKDSAGVGVLKPIARKDAKMSPILIVGIIAGTIVVLIAALLIRGMDEKSPVLLGIGAFLLAPPLILGGYSFLRDEELEPYRGRSLAIRVLVCSVVYALLWGAYAWLPSYVFNLSSLELFHVVLIVPPLIAAGAVGPLAALDLDYGNALVHFAFYLLVTVTLCFIIDINLLGAS